MSSPPPRRRAERRPSRLKRWGERIAGLRRGPLPVVVWAIVVLGGLTAIGLATADIAPQGVDTEYLSRGGAVAIASAYSWALAARTGGRPVIFGMLALLVGVAVIVLDRELLTTGAAVMTCVVSAVFAVMITVPAVRTLQAFREAIIAVLVAAVGAIATVGFEPVISLARFEYSTLALSLAGALMVVYRLGAGLHGLGTRGILTVIIGSVLLAVTLAYAELLRRYGTPGLVEWLFDGVRWSRSELGAFPRPIEAVLGIPALVWGCHMRARRRQGWWVCAFGVAATAPVANSALNVTVSRTESALAVLYAVVVGLVVGFVLIRADVALTAPRGRRGRRAEEATAVRPEPKRTSPLF